MTAPVFKITGAVAEDLKIMLPNGSEITLQYRCEGEQASLDIVLPRPDHVVNCWYGDDLIPAPIFDGGPNTDQTLRERMRESGHIRRCGQLSICLAPRSEEA